MKRLLLAIVIPVVLLTGSLGQAAAPGPNANGDAAATTLPIAAADATRLKTWITDQKTTSVVTPAGFTAAIGAVVPMTITLKQIAVTPAVMGVDPMKVQYAVIGDKFVLVDVSDRKVVYVFS